MSRRSSGRQQPSSPPRATRPRPGAVSPRPSPGGSGGARGGGERTAQGRSGGGNGGSSGSGGRAGSPVRRAAGTGRARGTKSRQERLAAANDESYRADVYSQVKLRSPDGPLRARADPLKNLSAPRRDDRTAMGLPARGRVSSFFADLGWRAYAIPVLVVATCLALLDAVGGDGGDSTTQGNSVQGTEPPPAPKQSIWVDAPADPNAEISGGALPEGREYTTEGAGEFDIVAGTSQIYGSSQSVKRFTVEIEQGIAGIRGDDLAREIEGILADERGWVHDGSVSFQRVDAGTPDFRVTLTTPLTVREICGYTLQVETSCFNRTEGRVVINLARWVRGAAAYGIDLVSYRQYALIHETGHAIGHGHEACPAKDALAPPMLQQTIGMTSTNGLTCKPNPWPFPNGDTEITGPPTDDPPT